MSQCTHKATGSDAMRLSAKQSRNTDYRPGFTSPEKQSAT